MNISEILLTNLVLDSYELGLLKSIISKLLTTGYIKPSLSIDEHELLKVFDKQINYDKISNREE